LRRRLDGSGAPFGVSEGQWFLDLEQPPATHWWDPDLIDGRDLMPFMPAGSSARLLRTVMTEAQMILHEHPVNVARTARGQLAANGLWPWGWAESPLPAARWTPPALQGEDRYARALTALCGQTPLLADPLRPRGSGLVILEFPADEMTLSPALEDLDRRWCEPILDALWDGRIERLRLATPAGRCCELRRLDLLRFWRRWRP